MTGYGAGEATRGGALARVELRAVNHRFFDPAIRISREYTGLEARVRERIAAVVSRGRVAATIDVIPDGGASTLVLDEVLVRRYCEIFSVLKEKLGIVSAVDPVAVAQLQDVVRRETPAVPEELAGEAIDAALIDALEQLTTMRRAEGAALRKDLESRVASLEKFLDRVGELSRGAPEKYRKRLNERIAQLVPEGVSPDPARLAMEVAILAEKSDIAEELVRFRAHDQAFLDLLDRGEAVGKRLDFLLQEMNREVNTIGSKSTDAEIAHVVVEIKEEIERLREQVQNIE
jgi:uncharacterized protein (TIGR00255 family)